MDGLGFLFACTAVSGLLIYLSFPPADLSPLAFVAFVPLLVVLGRARACRVAVLCGALAGAVAYLPAFAWLASVSVPGWVGVAFYVTLYLTVASMAVWLWQRRLGVLWPLAAALLWVGLELCRARLGVGFPWLFLGYTQYRFGALRQLAALGGVYAVSFVVFFVNAALAAAVLPLLGPATTPGAKRVAPGALAMLGVAAAVLVGCVLAGQRTERRVEMTDGPVVGVVQQNLPLRASEVFARPETPEAMCRRIIGEVGRAAEVTRDLEGDRSCLVAWPENTVPVPFDLAPDELPEASVGRLVLLYTRRALAELQALLGGCHFLIGAKGTRGPGDGGDADIESRDVTSSAYLLSPDGEIAGRYDKVNIVPFGEYIPLMDYFPFLSRLTPFSRSFVPGRRAVVLELPWRGAGSPIRFAALICYDDAYADLTNAFRRGGARFMVNVTYEGWYHIPGELRQHVPMAVFRAVETRTTVVRAANTGVSCFIDPRGEVYAELEPHRKGALSAPVRLCDAVPPYVRRGDAFGVICLMLAIAWPPLLIVLGARPDGRRSQ